MIRTARNWSRSRPPEGFCHSDRNLLSLRITVIRGKVPIRPVFRHSQPPAALAVTEMGVSTDDLFCQQFSILLTGG